MTVKLQEDRNKDLVSENNDLQDQISKLEEEKTKRETTLKKLEQELADSLAYGKVVTRYRQDLEKYLGLLKRNFADSKDQYVEAKKCNNDLKSMLDEKEKDLVQIKSKMEDLEVQLQKERSSCSQLKNRLDSLKHVSCRHDNLERTNKQLEEELIDLRSRMEISQMEQSRLEQRCRDTEDSARQELQQKLDEVNRILREQRPNKPLQLLQASSECSKLKQKIWEMESELAQLRTAQQNSVSAGTEEKRYQELYRVEVHRTKNLTARLDRANILLAQQDMSQHSEFSILKTESIEVQ